MTEQVRSGIKYAVLAVLLISAGVVGAVQLRKSSRTGEEGMQSFFFDESEQRIFLAPRESVPPLEGVGGEAGDGVSAILVACRGDQADPAKRRIAYLETNAPPLKQLFEDIRSARARGEIYEGKGPDRESDFVAKNKLVRREGETTWHAMNTKEGIKIVDEWKAWRCDDGQGMVVCTPE